MSARKRDRQHDGSGAALSRAAPPEAAPRSALRSGPQPAPTGPATQVEAILGATLQQATEILERAGELAPFGFRWNDGAAEPELLRPVTDDEFPASAAILAEMTEALRIEASSGGLLACALASDVVVALPEAGEIDAVRVNVEHRGAAPRAAYLPYRVEGARTIYGDMVVTPGEAAVFGPETA